MVEPVAYTIVALVAAGMAASFLVADPHSPTSRSLSLFWLLLGVSLILNLPASADIARDQSLIVRWQRLYSVLDAASFACFIEWLLRIGRTETPSQRARSREWILRAAQGIAAVYGLVGLALPLRSYELWVTPRQLWQHAQPAFYLFAIPYDLMFLIAAVGIVQAPPERARLG